MSVSISSAPLIDLAQIEEAGERMARAAHELLRHRMLEGPFRGNPEYVVVHETEAVVAAANAVYAQDYAPGVSIAYEVVDDVMDGSVSGIMTLSGASELIAEARACLQKRLARETGRIVHKAIDTHARGRHSFQLKGVRSAVAVVEARANQLLAEAENPFRVKVTTRLVGFEEQRQVTAVELEETV